MNDVQEIDLAELVKDKVDGIAGKLALMTVEQLGMLHKLEEEGANRTTLLAEIDREISRRKDAAALESLVADGDREEADQDGGPDQIDDGDGSGVDGTVDDDDDDADGDGTFEDDDISGARRSVLTVPAYRAALVERLLFDLAAGRSVAIVAADADGELLNIPPIEARPADLQRFSSGNRPSLIYTRRIALGMELPSVQVRQFFLLIAPGEVVAVCRLSADLHAGGGRKAEIPGRDLLFELG